MDFNYEEGSSGRLTAHLKNVVVERLRVQDAVMVLDSQGLPKASVSDITRRDCEFNGVTKRSIVRNANGVNLEKMSVTGETVKAL